MNISFSPTFRCQLFCCPRRWLPISHNSLLIAAVSLGSLYFWTRETSYWFMYVKRFICIRFMFIAISCMSSINHLFVYVIQLCHSFVLGSPGWCPISNCMWTFSQVVHICIFVMYVCPLVAVLTQVQF